MRKIIYLKLFAFCKTDVMLEMQSWMKVIEIKLTQIIFYIIIIILISFPKVKGYG
jgi:hypothetical protein